MTTLTEALKFERLSTYARLRGGYPVPMAGVVYWAGLGAAGYYLPAEMWMWTAFACSGLIFPLALIFSALFRNGFMKDKSAVKGAIVPAFISMFLFWPMAIAASWTAPALVPLILAIGMSLHWPVIGWTYGRAGIYSAHAIIRAGLAFAIWIVMPDATRTLLPFAVAGVYVATILVIAIDSGLVKARLGAQTMAAE